MSCCSMINPSGDSCTVHQVGLSGTPGCFNLLTRATIFWGKFFIIFELSLCLLSVGHDQRFFRWKSIECISLASWSISRHLCLSTCDDLRWIRTSPISCLIRAITNIFPISIREFPSTNIDESKRTTSQIDSVNLYLMNLFVSFFFSSI